MCRFAQTRGAGGRTLTSMHRHQGKQVSNARIDRMLRELNSDPSSQYFQRLFGLVGLCEKPAASKAEPREFNLAAPALDIATAR